MAADLMTPPPLDVAILRFHYRCAATLTLPRWTGATLRGGLGRALKQTFCDRPCLEGLACTRASACPYARLFAPDQADAPAATLHGLRDLPRPYVVRPPLDAKTTFAPNDRLVFDLVLLGEAIEYWSHLISTFTHLGRMGLGVDRQPVALVQVESVHPITAATSVVMQDGTLHAPLVGCPSASVYAIAQHLPTTLTLGLLTPMRVKHAGRLAEQLDCHVVVRALLRRISQLSLYFGSGAWDVPFKQLIALAEEVSLQHSATHWVDWGRTSGATGQHMQLGGLVGSVTYANVPLPLRALLALGSLTHGGKATVFGHGWYRLRPSA